MEILLTVVLTFLGLFGIFVWWVCTHVVFETHEITNVKNLMIVQHFNTGKFAQVVDMSMLESHGLAKLDQYFADIPFNEEEMTEGGFKQKHIEEDGEDSIAYWKMVKDTELILVKSFEGDYWLWGSGEEDG